MGAEAPPPAQASPADPRRPGCGRWLLRLGLVLASLALTFAAGEAWARLTDQRGRVIATRRATQPAWWVELCRRGFFESVDDPVRRYAMKPGAKTLIENEVTGEEWLFEVTPYRSRGPAFPQAKPAGEKRLLAVGDSFCFGMWSSAEETLVGHLARMATEAEEAAGTGSTWRAINLGVPGYHTGQQRRALEEDGLPLDPDVVLIYFNTNDITRDGFFFDDDRRVVYSDHLPLPVGLRRALWSSHLYGFVVQSLNQRWTSRVNPHLDPSIPWAHVRADNQEYCRSEIETMVRLCRERGIGVFFVNQPLMTYSSDARNPSWRIQPLVAWAEGVREELELPGINLLGWLRGYADGVDRVAQAQATGAEPPEQDFLPEFYFADPVAQRYFRLGETDIEIPTDPDFHLLGDGYGHLARLVYPAMQDAELVP